MFGVLFVKRNWNNIALRKVKLLAKKGQQETYLTVFGVFVGSEDMFDRF
jgi:hypothetical protein